MPPGIGYGNSPSNLIELILNRSTGEKKPSPFLKTLASKNPSPLAPSEPFVTQLVQEGDKFVEYDVPYSQAYPGAFEGDNLILNQYYATGGKYYPGLFEDLGIQQPQSQTQDQSVPPAEPQLDPFFQLALMFLYPDGLPGSQPQASPRGFGFNAPQQGPAPQPSLLDTLLGDLSQTDPLLAQLLGGF